MADGENIVSIRERLLKERNALLDLSTRNRLLNTPLRTRNNRAIEIVDEKATEVFRLLHSGRTMSFLPGVQLSQAERADLDPEDVETAGIPQPEDEQVDQRHSDLQLQTRLTSSGLQKRLFDIWYDARSMEEEQGVNILYLAVGLLRWYDAPNSEIARHAPLVLLPVSLERGGASDKFKLKGRGEPPSPNLTLQAKMKAEFNLVIEDFQDEDDLDLATYSAKVAETVSRQPRWEVLPDAMVLGFFSFAKFLMYRDLDPENWPGESGIDAHPLISALLRDGFPESEPLIADDVMIDEAIPPIDLNHVMDADSSQAVVIAEAAGGRTMVVKGPPGTGKSQTITNIIASAAARGRKVLFVAEKMAALEVVHRRLRQAGLGALTLELHSNKINKRAVLEELRRTKDAAPRSTPGDASVVQKLGEVSGELNAFAYRLHAKVEPSGLTAHQIVGRLVKTMQPEAPAGYGLDGAERWTLEETEERRRLVDEFAERLSTLGSVPHHPWRGVNCDALDPAEIEALDRLIVSIKRHLEQARTAAQVATSELGAPPPRVLSDLDVSAAWLRAAIQIPKAADREALKHPLWASQVNDLSDLVEAGQRWRETSAQIASAVNETGRSASYEAIRAAVVTKGRNLFRFLDGGYRAQMALFASYLTAPPPKSSTMRVVLIDQIMAAQRAKAAFEVLVSRGEAFGRCWRGEASDWSALGQTIAWRRSYDALPPAYFSRLAGIAVDASWTGACETLTAQSAGLRADLGALAQTLDLDLTRAFGAPGLDTLPLDALADRLDVWRGSLESVTRFIAFAACGRALERAGGGALTTAVHDGRLDAAALPPAFERAYAEVLRTLLFQDWPELRAFDGERQDRSVAFFRELDRARIVLAKEQIAARHAQERPKAGAGVGPLGVLNAELAKRRAHLPIRKLLEKAGPAIQQLKPVFMMSPLSVAQFLKPGGLGFDLLVMDEASQIEPVDALGAIARVQQLVVVGDERQLPPTAFFKKLTGEEDPEEADEGITLQAKDAESILDLCLAKGAPHRMLSWHYRSKHQSLIAVSNQEFYENKLFIVPSPYDAVAGMGLKFHLLQDAPYDRGGARINPREARIVAEAVISHAQQHPEQSLGVATFSVAQRQAVLKELEVLRRANPAAEDFFAASAQEPFFVKNLENIQGDERDVIFVSVGYGKTEQGYLAHNFGPLSGEGGERRLNVLISRAKLRCEVFCNFTGAEIDLERTHARGVAALKLFLTFAETGDFGLGEVTGHDHDSEFEAQVCGRLRSLGHGVKAQIGASGFRVDLAVADTEKPGRFVLGIECDGAQYHSSRSARDRDRLRQQVLEAHGWIIHRIWSTDWYLRPQEELRKVEAAIASAKAAWRDRDEEGWRAARAVPLSFEVEQQGDVDIVTAVVGGSSSAADVSDPVLYREAVFPVDRQVEPHQVPLTEMADYVAKIVEIEGPVHIDEVATRIRTLWGLQRAGARIRACVERAAKLGVAQGSIVGGPFYGIPGRPVAVRDRSQVSSLSLRKLEFLPPCEIEAGVLKVVGDNFGATRDELVQVVSRKLGFLAASAQLRGLIEAGIDHLLADGQLMERDGLLRLQRTP